PYYGVRTRTGWFRFPAHPARKRRIRDPPNISGGIIMHRKKVLVTGSSRGIGRACALAFAQAGYHVFINCRNSLDRLNALEREILNLGGTCTKVPGDVGNPDEVRR